MRQLAVAVGAQASHLSLVIEANGDRVRVETLRDGADHATAKRNDLDAFELRLNNAHALNSTLPEVRLMDDEVIESGIALLPTWNHVCAMRGDS